MVYCNTLLFHNWYTFVFIKLEILLVLYGSFPAFTDDFKTISGVSSCIISSTKLTKNIIYFWTVTSIKTFEHCCILYNISAFRTLIIEKSYYHKFCEFTHYVSSFAFWRTHVHPVLGQLSEVRKNNYLAVC